MASKVISKASNTVHFPMGGKRRCTVAPGENAVSGEELKILQGQRHFAKLCEQGLFTVDATSGAEKAPAEVEDAPAAEPKRSRRSRRSK